MSDQLPPRVPRILFATPLRSTQRVQLDRLVLIVAVVLGFQLFALIGYAICRVELIFWRWL